MAIEINGLEVALGRLEKLSNSENVKSAIGQATLIVERAARQNATKEIAPTIHSKVDGFEGTVYTNYYKAPYVEYGTGIYSDHPQGGRKEVPWVYVEGQVNEPASKRIYTEQEANLTVASMRAEGIPAVKTYGSEPRPYMRPALDENREEILRVLGEALLDG